MQNKETDWEKLTVYIAITVMLITGFIYIADLKERLKETEVKIDVLMYEVRKIQSNG